MVEIIISRSPHKPNYLENTFGLHSGSIKDMYGLDATMLMPYRPYLISERPSAMEKSIVLTLYLRDAHGILCQSCHGVPGSPPRLP
jgi:hypothetical protein